MTNAEIINRILRRLGNRTQQGLRQYCLLELETKIQEYEQGPVLPWFLETETTYQAVPGTEHLDLPPDFLRELEDGALWIKRTDSEGADLWDPLPKHSLDRVRVAELGRPEHYALLGSKIILGPVPDLAYQFKFAYLRKSLPFADNETESTDWLKEASNLVIFGAAAQVAATYIQNDALAGTLISLEKRALDALYLATEARNATNQDFNIRD